jgi:hypothetical protein
MFARVAIHCLSHCHTVSLQLPLQNHACTFRTAGGCSLQACAPRAWAAARSLSVARRASAAWWLYGRQTVPANDRPVSCFRAGPSYAMSSPTKPLLLRSGRDTARMVTAMQPTPVVQTSGGPLYNGKQPPVVLCMCNTFSLTALLCRIGVQRVLESTHMLGGCRVFLHRPVPTLLSP